MTRNSQANGGKNIRKFVMIAILALSLLAFPILPSPVHASGCTLTGANYTIEGCVVNYDTGAAVSGINVYLIACSAHTTWEVATDSNGYFGFAPTAGNGSPCILSNWAFPVSVNGATSLTNQFDCRGQCNYLGYSADDPTWSQWAGDVATYSNGNGPATIRLSAAQLVNVVEAALYSNTRFATMGFSTTQGKTVSQSVGISASINGGVGFSAGYEQSISESFSSTNAFSVNPGVQAYFVLPSYEIGYYCGGTQQQADGWSCTAQDGGFQGLVTAGVSEPTGAAYKPITTSDNPTPPSGSVTCPFSVPQGITQSVGYTTTSSTTITTSASFSVSSSPVSLFGASVGLSYTASTSWQNDDATLVTLGSTDGQSLSFTFYPASGPCNNLTFGSELHVWDTSSAPDYTMSANPSTVNVAPGSTGTTAITLTGFNGFNEQVSLTYSAPTGISVSLNPANLFVSSSSATSNPVISVLSTVPCGITYPVTIYAASSGNPPIYHSTIVRVAVNPTCNFSMSASPSSFTEQQGSSWSGTTTISVQPTGGFAGTVSLSANSNNPNLQLALSSTSVNTAGGTGSVTLTITDPNTADCGPSTITVGGQSAQLMNSVTIPLTITGIQGSCDFTISANPTSLSIYSTAPPCMGYSTITIHSVNGFSGTVNLSTSPSYAGWPVYAWTYTAPDGGGGVSSVTLSNGGTATVYLNIWADSRVTTSPYTVTVTASYGSISHQASVIVTFTNPSGCGNAVGGGSGGGGGGPPKPTSPSPMTNTALPGTKKD